MNFTCNVLLHALSKTKISAPKLRIQIDGASDNVNYAVYSLIGLLLLAGIFEEIELCRLPVGYVNLTDRICLV